MKKILTLILLTIPLSTNALFGIGESEEERVAREECKDMVEMLPGVNEKKLCIQSKKNSLLHKSINAPIKNLQQKNKDETDAIMNAAYKKVKEIEAGYNKKIKVHTDKQKELEEENQGIRDRINQAFDEIEKLKDKQKSYFGIGAKTSAVIDKFFDYARGLAEAGTKYRLGAKLYDGVVDCSGLITRFGVNAGIMSEDYMVNKGNALSLYNAAQYKKSASDVERGDILFFKPKQKGVQKHIGVVTKVVSNRGNTINIQMIDASYAHGVSKRIIEIYKEGNDWIYENEGTEYRMYGGSNPLLHEQKKYGIQNDTSDTSISSNDTVTSEPREVVAIGGKDLGQFSITKFDPSKGGINCALGGSCGHFADGGPVTEDLSMKVVACPYPNGVLHNDDYRTFYGASKKNPYYDPSTGYYPKIPKNPWMGRTFHIPGVGDVICKDVGGLITLAGQTNIRGNRASYNHMDLLMMGSDFDDPSKHPGKTNVYLK